MINFLKTPWGIAISLITVFVLGIVITANWESITAFFSGGNRAQRGKSCRCTDAKGNVYGYDCKKLPAACLSN